MKNILATIALLSALPAAADAKGIQCGSDNAASIEITMDGNTNLDSPGAIFQLTATNMYQYSFRAQSNVIESSPELLVLNFTTVTPENKLNDDSIHARLELPIATNEMGVRIPAGPGRIVITRRPTMPLRFLRGSYALLNCVGNL